MATTYKVLGQSNPAATTLTTLYTVPASTSAVCSTLAICNQGVSTLYRVAIRPAGASISAQQYIVFDATINSLDTMFLTIGTTLATTDVVSVYAGTATVSFNLFGSEVT
jgi:hypothetical protein